jgi:hypothetical protein
LTDRPELTVTHRELRKFALVFGSALAVIGGLLLPLIWKLPLSPWPWAVGAAFCAAGSLLPGLLAPFYRLWMKFGQFIGGINSRIILAVFFYLIISPMGLLMRIFRLDPLMRRLDSRADSYLIKSKQPCGNGMQRPF